MQRNIDWRELLVWGFIRNIERQYKQLEIPIEINSIIYSFQRLCDEWSTKYKSEYITIDKDEAMVTVNNDEMVTVYGQKVMTEGSYIWDVKIISFNPKYALAYIGIVQNDNEKLYDYLEDCDFDDYGYQLCGESGDLCYGLSGEAHDIEAKQCIWKRDGDILAMKLDLDEQTLSFNVNDTKFVELFSNIEIPPNGYRLALGIAQCTGCKFQLL